MVSYNLDTGLPRKYMKPIMVIIQEIKRNIIFRRYKRETTNGGIINYREERMLAHLLLIVQKLNCLRKYQGKNCVFL